MRRVLGLVFAALLALGCKAGQGFLFARPAALAELSLQDFAEPLVQIR